MRSKFQLLLCMTFVLFAAMVGPGFADDSTKPSATDATAPEMIAKGLGYLQSHQRPDGSWHSPKEPPGISAIVLKAFVQDPVHSAKDPFIAKGFEKLGSFQNPDGSVSEMLVTYNTAITVSAYAAAKDPQFKEGIDKAIAFLRGVQWTDKIQGVDPKNPGYGGFGYGQKSRPDLSNVQTALDALHDAGIKSDDPAYQAALKFVTRCQNRSESNDQSWAMDDGGFVYTAADGGKSSAGEETGPDGRRQLRSYGSMTYAGLKSMIYAGLSKDDPRVKAAWTWIGKNWTLDENPGMRGPGNPRSGDSGLFYYYHTLARALRAYGEPIIVSPNGQKHDWRLELITRLKAEQNADGSWTGTQKYMENRPVLSTTFGVLALQEAQADLAERPAK